MPSAVFTETIYGERLERTFDEAVARFLEEYDHKRSLERDIVTLKAVMPYICHHY